VYKGEQCYPEYFITYRRVWGRLVALELCVLFVFVLACLCCFVCDLPYSVMILLSKVLESIGWARAQSLQYGIVYVYTKWEFLFNFFLLTMTL
jgi:hypothetical protein